jgi:predicted nuclease of predicted toxin-antitoxin system
LPSDPRTASALLKIATAFNHDYDTGDYGLVYARWTRAARRSSPVPTTSSGILLRLTRDEPDPMSEEADLMPWIRLPKSSTSEDALLRRLRKARLYADEDIEDEVVQAIRDKGVNISSVRERGERGKPDEVHLATARREHRFLLTKDKDFLDDRRFPLQKEGPGIIYLHGDFRAEERYAGAVANLLIYIVPYSQIYKGAKIQLSEKHMTFRYIDYEGRVCVDECEIRPDGEYIKVDDAES